MTLFIINLSAAVELPEDKHICSSKGRLSEGRVSQSMVLRPAVSASPELNGNANAWDPPQTYCCSVVQSCPTLQPHGLQHARLPWPSLSPEVCLGSYPLSQ